MKRRLSAYGHWMVKKVQLSKDRGTASIGSLCACIGLLLVSSCGDNTTPGGVEPPSNTGVPHNGGAPAVGVGGTGGKPVTQGGTGGAGGQASIGGAGRGTGGAAGGQSETRVGRHALVVTDGGGCALDAIGAIQCWGNGSRVWTIPAGKFLAMANQGGLVCGVRGDLVLQCFNEPGVGTPAPPPAPIGGVAAVGVTLRQVYTLDEAGKVGAVLPIEKDVAPPPGNERLSSVTAGFGLGCGLRRSDGTIACWGSPGIGPGCRFDLNWPMVGQLDAPSGAFTDISTYDFTSCAVRNSGELACWGKGKPQNVPNPYPCDTVDAGQAVPPPGKFKRVAMGVQYGCAVAEDGHVECWGIGIADTCVEGSVECRQARPPAGTFDQVAVGLFHSCAMTAARKITCWGYPGPAGGDGRTMPPRDFQ